MDVPLYLARIGYTRPVKPDVQTLRGLHLAHMLRVPFENLDIGLRRPIRLSIEALWEKIIGHKRGGFCYELNGLFAWLLRQVGFRIAYLNGRVYNREGRLGSDFDHLALLVQIPGMQERWLADVGFGDSFVEPLCLDSAAEQPQGLRSYRLEQTPGGIVTWQRSYDGSWERQYSFDLQPRQFPSDYEAGCRYHQTSPQSSFTRGSIVSRATPGGRISLEDGWLIVTENGRRQEHRLRDKEEYRARLKEYFDIVLQEEQA